jgi:hypothetical protein
LLTNDARPRGRADTVPPALWAITLAALSPFLTAAMVNCYGPPELASGALTVLTTWSVVVLSFLGGVRWGLEMSEPRPRWARLALSALCPTAGWSVLLARGQAPDTWLLSGLIAVFLIQWLFDHQAPDTPSRYPKLSTTLTAVACASLALVLEQALTA